jgi:hypothetical protein
LRRVSYEYSIIRINGTYYFSPFGIFGKYNNLKYDLKHHIIPDAQRYFKQLNVPFKYLGDAPPEIDHVLKEPFREALGLKRETSYAVIVPGSLNSARTNTKPPVEFSLFDFRYNESWEKDRCQSFIELLDLRLFESLLWTLTTVINSANNSNQHVYNLVLDSIEQGYSKAINLEINSIQKCFLEANHLTTNIDSILAFLDKILLQARKNDFLKLQRHFLEDNKIRKSFAIRQAIAGASLQIRVAEDFNFLIDSQRYKNFSKEEHNRLTKDLETFMNNIIETNRNDKMFDVEQAKNSLRQLQKIQKNSFQLPRTEFSVVDLKTTCNDVLRLGDSYSNNGQVLDLTIAGAKQIAINENKPLYAYIIETSVEKEKHDNENFLLPLLRSLSAEGDRRLIENAPSKYSKLILEQTYSINNEKDRTEDSVFDQEYLDEFYSDQDIPIDDLPSAPTRNTSDEERLARLGPSQIPQN